MSRSFVLKPVAPLLPLRSTRAILRKPLTMTFNRTTTSRESKCGFAGCVISLFLYCPYLSG